MRARHPQRAISIFKFRLIADAYNTTMQTKCLIKTSSSKILLFLAGIAKIARVGTGPKSEWLKRPMNEAQSIRYGKGDAPAGHFGVLYAPRQCGTTAQNIQTQSSDRLIVVSLSSLTHEIQSKVLLSRSVETVSVAERAWRSCCWSELSPSNSLEELRSSSWVGRRFIHSKRVRWCTGCCWKGQGGLFDCLVVYLVWFVGRFISPHLLNWKESLKRFRRQREDIETSNVRQSGSDESHHGGTALGGSDAASLFGMRWWGNFHCPFLSGVRVGFDFEHWTAMYGGRWLVRTSSQHSGKCSGG